MTFEELGSEHEVIEEGVTELVAQHEGELALVELLERGAGDADEHATVLRREDEGVDHRLGNAERLDRRIDAESRDGFGKRAEEVRGDLLGQAQRGEKQVAARRRDAGCRSTFGQHGCELLIGQERSSHVAIAVEDEQVEIQSAAQASTFDVRFGHGRFPSDSGEGRRVAPVPNAANQKRPMLKWNAPMSSQNRWLERLG